MTQGPAPLDRLQEASPLKTPRAAAVALLQAQGLPGSDITDEHLAASPAFMTKQL